MRPGAEQNMMVDVKYRQGRDGTSLVTVVQDLYLCASMEFLLTVANIFLKATQQSFAQVPQSKNSAGAADKKSTNASAAAKDSRELNSTVLFCFDNCLLELISAIIDLHWRFPMLLSAAVSAVVSKTEMIVQVCNPEIVFVADLTRADAPALVMNTQCELLMKSNSERSQMTAVITDLKVRVDGLT